MADRINLTPGEAGALLAIAMYDGGQPVTVERRAKQGEPLDVEVHRPIRGEAVLYVMPDGRICRLLADDFQVEGAKLAGQTIYRRNLVAFSLADGPRPRGEADPVVELSDLADAQIDGYGGLTGRAGRDRMRELLDRIDRDEAPDG